MTQPSARALGGAIMSYGASLTGGISKRAYVLLSEKYQKESTWGLGIVVYFCNPSTQEAKAG
jgi:hypothetical protein